MFERLVMNGNEYDLLDNQYRSHPAILKVINTIFYGDRLNSQYYKVNKDRQLAFISNKFPIIMIDTSACNVNE